MQFLAAFSTSAFCKVQLILRSCGCGVGGVERTFRCNPAYHIAAHHAAFAASAICAMQLILRGLGANGGAGAECRTFFGVAGFASKPNF